MRWLRDAGVSSVELDSPARRTLESVLALRRRSEIKLAFCSQDQHLARTMWLCDLCGVPAIGLRAPEPRSSATWRSSAYGALANVKVVVDWLSGPARRGERSP